MFGIKKIAEGISDLKALLSESTQKTQDSLASLGQEIRDISRSHEQDSLAVRTDRLESAVEKLRSDVKHHNVAVEDMLESWEEFQGKQEELQKAISGMAAQDRIVQLCIAYEQQMHNIRRMAAEDPDWKKQLELIEGQLQPAREKAGFVVTGKKGEAADFSLHEVIMVQDTDKEDLNGRIESVYEPGICWQGQVYKKAKVCAWRFQAPL